MDTEARRNQFEDIRVTMQNLLTTGDFSDLVIECSGGKTINAHQNILASLSSHMGRLLIFHNDISPKIIGFPHIRLEVMQTIVTFLYTGEISDELSENVEFLKEVLEASYELRATHLFNYCKSLYLSYLQNESVIEMWFVLRPYNQVDGELEVINFILNHLNEVSEVEDLQKLTMEQMMKLAKQLDKNTYADDFLKFCIKWATPRNGFEPEKLQELSDLVRIIGTDTISNSFYKELFHESWIMNLRELDAIARKKAFPQQDIKITNIHFFDLDSTCAQTWNFNAKKWHKSIIRPDNMDIKSYGKSPFIEDCTLGNFIFRKIKDPDGNQILLRYDTADPCTDAEEVNISRSGDYYDWASIVGFKSCVYMWTKTGFISYNYETGHLQSLAHFAPDSCDRAYLRASRNEIYLRIRGHDNLYAYDNINNRWIPKTKRQFNDELVTDSICGDKWCFVINSNSGVPILAVYDLQKKCWLPDRDFPEGSNKLMKQSLNLPFLVFREKTNPKGSKDNLSGPEPRVFLLYYPDKDKWEQLPRGLTLTGNNIFCNVTIG